jgi:hypothetical protein
MNSDQQSVVSGQQDEAARVSVPPAVAGGLTPSPEQLDAIITAAIEFVHYPEVWESYEDLKTSISTSLPVEFMALCEAIEDAYGSPTGEDDAEEVASAA